MTAMLGTPAVAQNDHGHRHDTRLQVSVTIIDPCTNSHNLEALRCQGHVFQRVTEKLQQVHVKTVDGLPLPDAPAESFVVRTIDFY